MRLRRTLVVLVLAALTSLSPALAHTRPARAERTVAAPGLVDLLLDQLARIEAKVLGTEAGARLDPSGAKSDIGSSLEPDGTRNDSGSSLDPDGAK